MTTEEVAHCRARPRDAIRGDGAVCLECGARRKSLGHHVRAHGLSLRAYRDKWGYSRAFSLIVQGIPNVDPPRPTRRVTARELAHYRVHFREAAREDAVVCLECGRMFRRLAAHLPRHHLTIDDYREKWGYRCTNPLMVADLVERKRRWAIAKNLAGFSPPGILREAHEALRRGRPPVRLETRLNKSDYMRSLLGGGWRPPNLKVAAGTLRALVQQGLTQKEIGERTGLRPANVWRRLHALGLRAAPPRPRPLVDAKDAQLLALRQAGLWNQEIGQRTGMKPGTVSARFERMRERGVSVPTPARPVPTPRRRVSDEQLIALIRQGLRPAEIAGRVKLSTSNVRVRLRSLRRRGMRPAGAPRRRKRKTMLRGSRGGEAGKASRGRGAPRRRTRRSGPVTRRSAGRRGSR